MWGKFSSWWDSNVVHGGINTSGWIPEKGSVGYMGAELAWDQPSGSILTTISRADEEDYLKYGAILLGIYVVITKWK